jgi:transposase
MDSSGYSEDNLKEMEKVHWLTRVPETIKRAREPVAGTQKSD